MRKKISDRKKSEIVNLHLRGLTRDECAKKTGVSAGGVSGVIKDFTDCADSTSIDDAAKKYDAVETIESLRSLAGEIKNAGTSVEELMEVSKTLRRIKKLIDLDKLEGYIKAGESLSDKAHVEASVMLHAIEERTGLTHDEILAEVERKDARLREQSEEIQRRNTKIKNLEDQKAKLAEEEKTFLKQYRLTMARVEHVTQIEEDLSRYKIDLTKLEGFQRVLGAIEEAGYDPKEVVEQIRKKGALQLQIETYTKDLADIQGEVEKLNEVVSTLEKKLAEAESTLEKYSELESMGWNHESLERALKLAKKAGSPEETLSRLELLKPSAEAKAELERTKAEAETLKEKASKMIEQTLENLSTLTEKSSSLVNERIPVAVTDISSLAKETNNLAEKYNKLQADFTKLVEEYQKYKKRLDDAIGWTSLLQEPEELPADTIAHVFFDVMFPKLEAWCKSKNYDERSNIAGEMAKRAICLYEESTANFMKTPEKASVVDTKLAILSFATATMPFYAAFMKWYKLHEHENANFYSAYYHLEQFYEKGIANLKGS